MEWGVFFPDRPYYFLGHLRKFLSSSKLAPVFFTYELVMLQPGRRPYDNLLIFKGLVLQHWYNLSDEELEFQIRDRVTFMRFLGLPPEAITPDGNAVWDVRELLVNGGNHGQ